MTIPLWLPWAVFAALALPPVVALLLQPSGSKPTGSTLPAFSAAAVALAVAVALSVGRWHVSHEEFTSAVGRATHSESGANPQAFLALVDDVEQQLGRDIDWENADAPPDADEDGSSRPNYYELRPSKGSDVVVCVSETVTSGGETYLDMTGDACDV